jgi:hypothetical protein
MRRYGTPWLLDVPDCQRAEFLAPDGVIEQGRQDGAVTLAFERVFGRGLQELPGLVVAERRRHAVAVHRARPLDAQHGVMQHRMFFAEIGIEG